MITLPEALAPMGAFRQFIAVKTVANGVKTTKLPVDYRTGQVANAHDSSIWVTAQTAINAAHRLGPDYHVGFVFTASDPFWFLDIDNCLVNNAWTPLAHMMCQAFSGAAVEVSQSGRGLHIFGTGKIPAHACKNIQEGMELYHEGRFVLLSGNQATGNAASDHSLMLSGMVATYFKPSAAIGNPVEWTDAPCEGWAGPADDTELITRMLRSKSASNTFGAKASFSDLWTADIDKLSKAYPDSGERAYDASSADAALAAHLAFWTGKNCERIKSLMQTSALVRPKYEREDYLQRTIINACSRQREVLTDQSMSDSQAIPAIITEGMAVSTTITGSTMLSPEQQKAHFHGCVYVVSEHKVLVPGGKLLDPHRFKVVYGGRTFVMDQGNEKTTTDAFEAFTQSKVESFPKADSACFKPELGPAVIITDAGRVRVNSYWPIDVPRVVGDAAPFFTHLEKLLPVPRDRDILLSYMAAVVQHKGVKFQWTPLLQGVEGNGKSFFTRCVSDAIGDRYVHWPRADQITEKFNGWLFDKIFIAVEDIYTADHKNEVLEILKPMITGKSLAKRVMNTDQINSDVCCNFMLNSNHKDGIRKTRNDRRFCHLFTKQQEASDIIRDGMGGDYFYNLYHWLDNGGSAIISELLHTMPIDNALNPAIGCQRAPVTSSTEEAISAGQGGMEQHIQEAIDTGRPGFNGGWVSSIQLSKLIDEHRAGGRFPINKRRELMRSLGYDYHAGLRDGRTDNPTAIDNGKPRLFIRTGHLDASLQGSGAIARRYQEVQMEALKCTN